MGRWGNSSIGDRFSVAIRLFESSYPQPKDLSDRLLRDINGLGVDNYC